MHETITPSETVLLHGLQFSTQGPTVKKYYINFPLDNVTVESTYFIQTVLTCAFLANRNLGVLRIATVTRKQMLGLITKQVDVAEATDTASTVTWPVGSLEDRVLQAARKSVPKGPSELSAVFAEVLPLGENPVQDVVEQMLSALQVRGLVARQETKTLKVFKSHAFLPNASTEEARHACSLETVNQLLQSGMERDLNEMEMLKAAATRAVQLRTKTATTSDANYGNFQ